MTIDQELAKIRALDDDGRSEEYAAAVVELAARVPDHVGVRIEAAYACDEHDQPAAIAHYDAAWQLGVPADQMCEFVIGYGEALREVGRVDEALARLGEAVGAFPDYPPLKVFLSLALHASGHRHVALATLLDVVLDLAAAGDELDGYDRALLARRNALLERAVGTG